VEDKLGISVSKYDYRHTQGPLFPVDGQSYEVEDLQTGKPWKGIFLAGWSRIASSGLVGNAKKDGTNAAEAISSYLRSQGPNVGIPLQALEERVASSDCTVVRKDDLKRLLVDEHNRAAEGNPEEVPYLTNEEMLKVMGLK
jgi:ferredoxin--NADP+ reductase